jgi:hypothetical protein
MCAPPCMIPEDLRHVLDDPDRVSGEQVDGNLG